MNILLQATLSCITIPLRKTGAVVATLSARKIFLVFYPKRNVYKMWFITSLLKNKWYSHQPHLNVVLSTKLEEEEELGGMKPSLMVTHAEHTAHSEICSLLLTHPSTRSLVLGAVGSYCTAPGEQWGVWCLAQGHHGRAGGELGPLQVAVQTPYFKPVRGLEPATLQLPVQAPTD